MNEDTKTWYSDKDFIIKDNTHYKEIWGDSVSDCDVSLYEIKKQIGDALNDPIPNLLEMKKLSGLPSDGDMVILLAKELAINFYLALKDVKLKKAQLQALLSLIEKEEVYYCEKTNRFMQGMLEHHMTQDVKRHVQTSA